MRTDSGLTTVLGAIPYRLALAGGWIDQPFVSQRNPVPPGSMVVVSIEPTCWFMERAGIATGTRNIATRLWQGRLPARPPAELVRELYEAENRGRSEPSGSQDMIGLIYPGLSRLDYDFQHAGGVFPCHIESNQDPQVAQWLEQVLQILPVAARPEGYNPLGVKNLDPQWIQRLGKTGQSCYDAILRRDAGALGDSLNECMACWETLLPHTVRHPAVTVDLPGLLQHYQSQYAGAMYSGCGGGYLFVVSEQPVPGTLRATVRLA
ncbi:MAG: hypothetical protein ACYC3X_23290 [Pirellulaceae bacterium]